MADSTLPSVATGATAISASLDASDQDDAPGPLPLNGGPTDPEKAEDRNKQSGTVRPGAKWKDKEVQNIPKK